MGTKRVGLARIEALVENLKREINQYQEAARNYTKKQLFFIFKYIKEYDLRSKGIKNKSVNQNELLRELTFKILHT